MIDAIQGGANARGQQIAGDGRPLPADTGSGSLGRRLDGLIGMLSHDLRTPLSAISGWLFLLESGKLDAEGQKRAVSKIRASVEEQVQLIDDTVLISRGQTGRLEIDVAPVPLRKSLDAAIDARRPQATAKNVTLESATGLSDATVEGDGELLQRIFDLLLAHALKMTPAGGRISVAVSAAPGSVRIEITDSGAGFSAAELPFVLEPFRQPTDGTAGSARGAERGLLLAQALIAAHCGNLALTSAGAGQGETLAVALPATAKSSR